MITYTKYEQSAFTLQINDSVIAVDFGTLASEETLTQIGTPAASVVSHIHKDHFLLENLARFKAPIYTVSEVVAAVGTTDLQVTTIAEGQTLPITGTPFELRATASNHGTFISAPVENVGYVLSAFGKSVYFLGDMAISTPPPAGSFDITLIPIGNRGYVFNAEQALSHLRTIEHPGIVIPIHYDHGDPTQVETFQELIGDTYDLRVMKTGKSLTL
ncbi:MAG: MBL fold metallo-hydrolase [bacterium]